MGAKIWWVRKCYRLRRWWWATWSHIYIWLFQRKYAHVPLPTDLTPLEVAAEMRVIKWTKDGTKELGDSIGSAEWFQYLLNVVNETKEQPKGAVDCDNFAMWAYKVLDQKYAPYLLCLSWRDEDGGLHGHCVCGGVGPESGEFFHVGNWGYMGGHASLGALLRATVKRAKGTGIIAWAILNDNLYIEKCGFSFPE